MCSRAVRHCVFVISLALLWIGVPNLAAACPACSSNDSSAGRTALVIALVLTPLVAGAVGIAVIRGIVKKEDPP